MNKKILAFGIAASLAILSSGCVDSNSRGPCIGIQTAQDKNTSYEWSIRNCAVGIIFSETIIVPVIVLATDCRCPKE
jgi:hypothetical protein